MSNQSHKTLGAHHAGSHERGTIARACAAVVAAFAFVARYAWSALVGVGAAVRGLGRRWRHKSNEQPLEVPAAPNTRVVGNQAAAQGGTPNVRALVEQMVAQYRYALLLRPQIVGNLDEDQLERTLEALAESMSLVPAGEVTVAGCDDMLVQPETEGEAQPVVEVEAFYLDRFAVTNAQFQQFVASGGYEQMALWDPEVWPALLDFVDASGAPGPKFWNNGSYSPGEESYPVVGICWYEAAAYARWIGKRLPSDAEWVKAGGWPMRLHNGGRVQRKFPWGDAMGRQRANLWGTGPGHPVAVDKFPDGSSVSGVYQLIGNVWEWTSTELPSHWKACQLGSRDTAMPLKSLRGGAFNTYFESQATCEFQSGDHPLARKNNIGFRCALGACDLSPERARPAHKVERQVGELLESVEAS